MEVWIYLVIMAVVQGITEFLPVSSSGHLAVLAALFGFEADKSQTLGIMLHAGSLIAIVIFYWDVLVGFLRPKQWKLAAMLILATIPAGTVGMALETSGVAEKLFDNLLMTGLAFMITATLLRLSEKPKLIIRPASEENFEPAPLDKVSWRQALAVGIGQMCAIIPGLSRSGTTITVGILSGINREAAGTFSFLLAIPVIGGAVLVHFLKLLKHPPAGDDISFLQMGVGLAVSAAVSYFSLVLLTRLIKRGKLSVFSWYLYALGLGVILWQMAAMFRKGN